MAFFSNNKLNPKRKFRWVVEFDNVLGQGSILKVAAKAVNKPSYSLDVTKHKFINHEFNYPNRVVWNPINLTLIDHIGHGEPNTSVAGILYGMLQAGGYQTPLGPAACENSYTKARATTALGAVKIIQLSGEILRDKVTDIPRIDAAVTEGGGALETWTLNNAFLTKVEFGELSYDDDALVEIKVEIVYDWADLGTGTGNVA